MKIPTALGAVLTLGLAAQTAGAHIAVSSNPYQKQGCIAGFRSLGASYALLGALVRPKQVDSICFDASPGDLLKAQIVIPALGAYGEVNDVTFVLVGPGLPASANVPDGLPPGDGAIFASINAQDGPFPKRNYLGNWYGPRMDLTLTAGGNYEIRVYSPSDWHGEYYLTTTGNDPSAASSLQDTKLPLPGDLDGDGKVTVQDAIQALVIAIGIEPIPSSFVLMAGDVAPPGNPDTFTPPGDGVIDLADVTRILRRAVGLDNSSDWPLDLTR